MKNLTLVAASLVLHASPATARDSRPNIILVMADDQGWGDMAYQGHARLKTPHFDKAAAAGLRFDRFYAAAPVCSPTRASVLTGRTPNRMGVFKWGYPMRPQETTLAEALKEAGYTTGHFGKWHLGSVRKQSPANPGACGFDDWCSAPNFYDNDPILSRKGEAVRFKGESSIVTAKLATDWIDSVTAEGGAVPFFAVVWFGSPHDPHRALAEDREPYKDLAKNHQNFLGEVTGMDRAFGKLRDHLEVKGLRENTILWYCSDNGALPKVGSTGGHRGTKKDVYEGGLLVPAFVEWPAVIKSPRTTRTPCVTSDFFPTLLQLAGASPDSSRPLDGVDLTGLLRGKSDARDKGIGFWDTVAKGISTPSDAWMSELLASQQAGRDLPPHPSSAKAAELPSKPYGTDSFLGHSAWIDGEWKLHRIERKSDEVRFELYHLGKDRKEEKDLAPAEPERVAAMKKELEAWLASVVGSLNGDDY